MLSLGFLLRADAGEAKAALEGLKAQTEAITSGIEGDFSKASAGIVSKLTVMLPTFGLVAGAVAAVGGAIYEMANKASEMGAKLYDASQATGVSVEMLQGLQLAGKQVGVSMEMIERAAAHLTLQISNLSTSGSQAGKALHEIGLSATYANGKSKSLSDLLPEIADRFEHMKNGADKLAIASALFGARVGMKMIPVLNEGGKALQELTRRAVEYSGVNQDVADRDKKFQDSLIILKSEFAGLAGRVGQVLIPTLLFLFHQVGAEVEAFKALGLWIDKLWHEFDLFSMKISHSTAGIAEQERKIKALDEAIKATVYHEEHFGESIAAAAKLQAGFDKALANSKDIIHTHAMAIREDASALRQATMDAHGYQAQLESMREVVEQSADLHQRAADAAHQQIAAAKEHAKMGPSEHGGMLQLPTAMQTLSTNLPKIKEGTDSATASFMGMAQVLNNMAASFGRGGAGAAQFSESMHRVIAAHQKGMPIMKAFMLAQQQQGETAKEAGTSMALSYGMEAASFIKNRRAQAVVMAIMETAKGLSELFWNPAAAALDFASAAMYGVIAGTTPGQSGGGSGGGGYSKAGTSGASGQGVVGQSMLGGGGGSSRYHQTTVNIWGGQITDTNNLQNLVTTLNQGGQSGMIRMNVAGTSATIPTPAY